MTARRQVNGEYAGWLLRELVSIPSVSGQERRASTFLAEQMALSGMRSYVDAVGNAHGIVGPRDAPTVMLLGHIDTVPGGGPVCRVGDLLFGRGSVDAKGSLVAMVCGALLAEDVRVHFVAAVGEEVPGSVGAHHVLATVPRPDALIIGEPSGWDGVCIGYKGRVGVHYEIDRPPQHTSSPEPTAAELAAGFVHVVHDYLNGLNRSPNPIDFGNAQATLTSLSGDLAHAEAFLTCRVPPGFDFDALHEHLSRYPHSRIWFDERVVAVRQPRSDIVASQLRAAIVEQGGKPTLKLKAGTSDMNTLAPWQVPMVAYGPGDAHLDHTEDEHIPLRDLARSVDVLANALTHLGRRLAADRNTAQDTRGTGLLIDRRRAAR